MYVINSKIYVQITDHNDPNTWEAVYIPTTGDWGADLADFRTWHLVQISMDYDFACSAKITSDKYPDGISFTGSGDVPSGTTGFNFADKTFKVGFDSRQGGLLQSKIHSFMVSKSLFDEDTSGDGGTTRKWLGCDFGPHDATAFTDGKSKRRNINIEHIRSHSYADSYNIWANSLVCKTIARKQIRPVDNPFAGFRSTNDSVFEDSVSAHSPLRLNVEGDYQNIIPKITREVNPSADSYHTLGNLNQTVVGTWYTINTYNLTDFMTAGATRNLTGETFRAHSIVTLGAGDSLRVLGEFGKAWIGAGNNKVSTFYGAFSDEEKDGDNYYAITYNNSADGAKLLLDNVNNNSELINGLWYELKITAWRSSTGAVTMRVGSATADQDFTLGAVPSEWYIYFKAHNTAGSNYLQFKDMTTNEVAYCKDIHLRQLHGVAGVISETVDSGHNAIHSSHDMMSIAEAGEDQNLILGGS